jgi:hypothetical protein
MRRGGVTPRSFSLDRIEHDPRFLRRIEGAPIQANRHVGRHQRPPTGIFAGASPAAHMFRDQEVDKARDFKSIVA